MEKEYNKLVNANAKMKADQEKMIQEQKEKQMRDDLATAKAEAERYAEEAKILREAQTLRNTTDYLNY